jgi:aryl-alcohol dehydrogenase-like predicted oxidoreductase
MLAGESKSGLALPGRVGLGTAPLGASSDWSVRWEPIERSDAVATIRGAVDAGVRWIDTAPFYGWGRAEEIVGEAVQTCRDDVWLLTKCGTLPTPGGSREDHRPDAIRADVEASLRRLRTDHIDVLQLHDPDPSTPVEEAWATIAALIAEGKVRAGGLSNHAVALMDRANAITPVTTAQHQYSLLDRTVEHNGVLPWCQGHGVPLLAWSPLGSGFLVDGFDPGTLDAQDFRRRLAWAEPERLAGIGRLRAELARIGGPTRPTQSARQVAVGWLLAERSVHVIIGARSRREAAELGSYRPLANDEAHAARSAAEELLATN